MPEMRAVSGGGFNQLPNFVGQIPPVQHSSIEIALTLSFTDEVQFIQQNWPDPANITFGGGAGLTQWQLQQYANFMAQYNLWLIAPPAPVATDVPPMWLRDP